MCIETIQHTSTHINAYIYVLIRISFWKITNGRALLSINIEKYNLLCEDRTLEIVKVSPKNLSASIQIVLTT